MRVYDCLFKIFLSQYSLIVDLSQTMVVGHQAKVFAWYDNEWGYANRMLDICQTLAKL